jgi:hypothetical protein
VARIRLTAWFFPTYSSRWSDLFGYGQGKVELRTRFPLRPYVSLRFIGDSRRRTADLIPRNLSESSFVPAVGVSTPVWHGAMGWAEAGVAANYLGGHVLPDYRAGAHYARSMGRPAASEAPAWFAETNTDAVFISRFGNDMIVYGQARAGVADGWKELHGQLYWNGNLTFDARRQAWANFWETGPGVRIFGSPLPKGAYVSFDVVRGAYLIGSRQSFSDIRAGVWYAFTR